MSLAALFAPIPLETTEETEFLHFGPAVVTRHLTFLGLVLK